MQNSDKNLQCLVQYLILHKGGGRFFKNGCNGGDGKVLPENGASQEGEGVVGGGGVGFVMGGWEIFKVSSDFLG